MTDGKTTILPGTYLEVTSRVHGPAGPPRPSVVGILAERRVLVEASRVVPTVVVPPQVEGPANLPPGFGAQIPWTGDEDLAILAFINAKAEYGLCVQGVRDGDIYEHVAAVGTASFSTGNNNGWIGGLITVVAVGLEVAADAFGQAELEPLITAGANYAKAQFPESAHPNVRRDPYGFDPSGSPEAAEGGVIVCGPSAQGVYHSGDSDHTDRWIQRNRVRNDANMPRHIPLGQAFFLQQGMQPRTLHGNGDLFLAAWDWNFPDNSGFYLIHAILRRGHRS